MIKMKVCNFNPVLLNTWYLKTTSLPKLFNFFCFSGMDGLYAGVDTYSTAPSWGWSASPHCSSFRVLN